MITLTRPERWCGRVGLGWRALGGAPWFQRWPGLEGDARVEVGWAAWVVVVLIIIVVVVVLVVVILGGPARAEGDAFRLPPSPLGFRTVVLPPGWAGLVARVAVVVLVNRVPTLLCRCGALFPEPPPKAPTTSSTAANATGRVVWGLPNFESFALYLYLQLLGSLNPEPLRVGRKW